MLVVLKGCSNYRVFLYTKNHYVGSIREKNWTFQHTFSRVSGCDIVCSSLLGEEEHCTTHIQIEFHARYFSTCTLFDSVLLVFCYWFVESTPCMCVTVNNALMFFFVFTDRLLVSSITAAVWSVQTMFTRRLSWRESRSTFCSIQKVTSPFFDILASFVMSLGKPQFILVVPHTTTTTTR
jgi:hypothetical protein